MSPLPKNLSYSSLSWRESETMPPVRFAVRRISLAHRLELTKQVRELTLRYEFLNAGETSDQLEAALSDLLVRKLYIEWGLAEIVGLVIDGEAATASLLIQKGPEDLAGEIISAIREEIELSEDERKNS
ncbi:MAG TPA: hypothetical protein VK604_00985 [Bryobacteraceae bacterium]|nr:hypothetical protein [Bryobacteraceae bacterium]